MLVLAFALHLPQSAHAQASARESSLVVASDLRAEASMAAAQGKAYVVLFSETGCPWCERARREFLLPMQEDPQFQGKAVFRQVNVDSDAALKDFDGRASTQHRFAVSQGVRLYPTVMLYTPEGKEAAARLRGYTSSVYYGSSIEQRIEMARAKTARPEKN